MNTEHKSEVVHIQALMEESGVKFGTSGARGLVVQMTDRVCVAYTLAFLEHHRTLGLGRASPVIVGGDLRPSTPRITRAVTFAVQHLGYTVEFAGWVPSPAVAQRGFELGVPSVMITGSHIPDDRNGMKFNTSVGELTKLDEEAVRALGVTLPPAFDEAGMLLPAFALPVAAQNGAAEEAYFRRFVSAFPAGFLKGVRVGVYGHSAVGRDLMVKLYQAFGAEVVRLGYSETFIPVDTEAIREEDIELAKKWAQEHQLDAIVSTDGDSDRPLIADERGAWLRGDVTGVLVAKFLGADAVVTPVSSNTVAEAAGFERVIRTRIGSPFVIAGMEAALGAGSKVVVGYEANGGFLSVSSLQVPGGGVLTSLPTRDALIVQLALLLQARKEGRQVSDLLRDLPARYTASERDQQFSPERSARLFDALQAMTTSELSTRWGLGNLISVDETDGYRMTFLGGEILHLRPSGNAPELRSYAEADTRERAQELMLLGLEVARALSP